MQQSSDGTWNLAWKGMKLNMNNPCLGRGLHDESLFQEAAGARWHTSTSYHHHVSKTKRNAACEKDKRRKRLSASSRHLCHGRERRQVGNQERLIR